MSQVVLSGDTSGAITLASPAIAGSNTATLPAATGTVMVSGAMPAFSAYQSGAAQSITAATHTKIQINTEEFDTNNCYDNTTNYRFTPNIAGYYQLNGNIQWGTNNAGSSVTFYKNGSAYKQGLLTSGTTVSGAGASALIYLNGSTDYVEMYAFSSVINTTSPALNTCYFQASMVRAA